jgi:hypothetical protein
VTLPSFAVHAPKTSKTTPCKVAGSRQHSTKQFDTSGKSGAFFHYSEILYAPVARSIAGASLRLRLKPSPTIEITGITAASDRLRVAEPRAWPARA